LFDLVSFLGRMFDLIPACGGRVFDLNSGFGRVATLAKFVWPRVGP